MKVGDVMSDEVKTIGPDAPLKEAAQLMVRSGVSGLPVVDDKRKVVGMVTEADFVTAEANRSWGRQRRRLLANFLGEAPPMNAKFVSDVMTADPHTIDMESTVTEAARMMTDLRVKRLPVVLPDGTLSGIISRADVMGVFARPDEDLAAEILGVVAVEVLQLDTDHVTVEVSDGVAKLGGQVPSRSDAKLFEQLALRVEGVVAVDSAVDWVHDDSMGEPTPGL